MENEFQPHRGFITRHVQLFLFSRLFHRRMFHCWTFFDSYLNAILLVKSKFFSDTTLSDRFFGHSESAGVLTFVCITDGLLGRGDTTGHRVRGHVGRSDGARRWDSEIDVSGQGISETARVVAERRRPRDSHQGR